MYGILIYMIHKYDMVGILFWHSFLQRFGLVGCAPTMFSHHCRRKSEAPIRRRSAAQGVRPRFCWLWCYLSLRHSHNLYFQSVKANLDSEGSEERDGSMVQEIRVHQVKLIFACPCDFRRQGSRRKSAIPEGYLPAVDLREWGNYGLLSEYAHIIT